VSCSREAVQLEEFALTLLLLMLGLAAQWRRHPMPAGMPRGLTLMMLSLWWMKKEKMDLLELWQGHLTNVMVM
jgi:hypothetical protein